MKKVLKIVAAVCLGIFIWILLMVFLFSILKAKTDSLSEEIGMDSMEDSEDVTENQAKRDDGESTNLTIDVNGNSFPTQNSRQEEIYYDSIQEAVNANYKESDIESLYQCNLKNIIKEFEINDYIVVCYNAVKNSKEESFIMAYFRVKEEGGNKKYAYVWNEIQNDVYSKKKRIELEELVQNDISTSKFRMINSIRDENGFICGTIDKIFLEKGEDVYNLKIEGQKPNEIIEYESFGDISYFWYCNSFQSDKPIDELKVSLDE